METTRTKTTTDPLKQQDHRPTIQSIHDQIVGMLDEAKRLFPRSSYLELLVRVADTTNDRTDAINEEIAKEQYEDSDE